MTSEDLETVWVQESYVANGTGNWSQSRAEPPAVKKRQLLPREGTGTGGKKWACRGQSSYTKAGRGRHFPAREGMGSGLD